MPNKKTVRRSPRKDTGTVSVTSTEIEPLMEREAAVPNKRKIVLPAVILLVLVIVGLGYLFKDSFVAAMVDGKPILRFELNKRLAASYGKETLENLIVERLIQTEAKKKNVAVADGEINDELDKIGKNLSGGMKIEDALSLQGISLSDFKQQIKLRLEINKILEKEITVSSEEIDKYLKDNEKTMVATGESERKVEAEQTLKEQKISEKIQTWVSDLLTKAKISRFLK